MENHEALIIEGAERFSRYTGYSNTFRWAGDFNEASDANNTRYLHLHINLTISAALVISNLLVHYISYYL